MKTEIQQLLSEVDRKVTVLEVNLKKANEHWYKLIELEELCPGGLPDGTGMMSAKVWIRWAKKQLGYREGV